MKRMRTLILQIAYLIISTSCHFAAAEKTLLQLAKTVIAARHTEKKEEIRKTLLRTLKKDEAPDKKTLLAVVQAYHTDHTTLLSTHHTQTLNESINLFHNKPGLSTKIYDLLKNANTASFVKGHTYELETALSLYKKRERVTHFGYSFYSDYSYTNRSVDLATSRSLIECKNINWSKLHSPESQSKRVCKIQKQLLSYQYHADDVECDFILHSKQPIPPKWQEWLDNNGIAYQEDACSL